MSDKIQYNSDQMFRLGKVIHKKGSELQTSVVGPLEHDLSELDSIVRELAKYNISVRHAPETRSHRRGAGSLGAITRKLLDAGDDVAGLQVTLTRIEHNTETEVSRAWQPLSGAAEKAFIKQRDKLLNDPRAYLLGGAQSVINDGPSETSAERASELRQWLREHAPDPKDMAWLVANCPGAARLLAEHADNNDPLVVRLHQWEHEGKKPLDFFLSLSKADRLRLTVLEPSVVGKCDGAPAELRSDANRLRLIAYRGDLLDELTKSDAGGGYTLPARDAATYRNRLRAIDHLLGAKAGHAVLDFDKPDDPTKPMTVVLDTDKQTAGGAGALLTSLNSLIESAQGNQEKSQAVLESLKGLRHSDDPDVRALAEDLADRTRSGLPFDASTLEKFGKSGTVLTSLMVASHVWRAVDGGHTTTQSVLAAAHTAAHDGAGIASGLAAAAACGATFGETGVGAVTCPLVGLAAGTAGSSAFDKLTGDDSLKPAPGDPGSDIPAINLAGDDYDPARYVPHVPRPTPAPSPTVPTPAPAPTAPSPRP